VKTSFEKEDSTKPKKLLLQSTSVIIKINKCFIYIYAIKQVYQKIVEKITKKINN